MIEWEIARFIFTFNPVNRHMFSGIDVNRPWLLLLPIIRSVSILSISVRLSKSNFSIIASGGHVKVWLTSLVHKVTPGIVEFWLFDDLTTTIQIRHYTVKYSPSFVLYLTNKEPQKDPHASESKCMTTLRHHEMKWMSPFFFFARFYSLPSL